MLQRKLGLRILISFLVVALLSGSVLQPVVSQETKLRVIVRGDSVLRVTEAVAGCGGEVESEIGIINAVVATVPESCVEELIGAPGVTLVTPDRDVQLSAAELAAADRGQGHGIVNFTEVIGVQEVWDAGNLGEGVTVAVLDTGIDPAFIELRRTQGQRGRDRFLAYYDAIEERFYRHPHTLRSPRDPNGHGSHVAGIIANGRMDGQLGEYRGVAPAVDLVAVRVLNDEGAGTYADVLKGIDWAVRNKDRFNIRVLNVSMYSVPVAPYWADPYNLAVMAAWDAGIVVVASAGNTGPDPMSVGVPGNTPYVVTAGAFTDHRTPDDFSDDYMPEFSASGPTLDAFAKPDVIAPGAHVVSLMRPTSYLRRQNPEFRVTGRYFEMSGTSMSTGVVSGIAALIISQNPDLTPDEVKHRLTQTARPQLNATNSSAAYSLWQQGAGRVWAADAVLGDIAGTANEGMDLASDLAGSRHYEGWTTYDAAAGTFRILGGGFDGLIDGYTTWDGSHVDWSSGYAEWAEGSTNWSGSFNSWADSFNSWADSFNSWADSFNSWADSYNSWADSFNSWADTCLADPSAADPWRSELDAHGDSFNSWADSFNSWADYVVWTDSFNSWADSFNSWADGYEGWAPDASGCDQWIDSFNSWADGFAGWAAANGSVSDGLVVWTGAYGTWTGGYMAWSDSFNSWADSFNSWADGYSAWANVCGVEPDSFNSWADSFNSWADGTDAEADSFNSWADSFNSWADSFNSWADYVVYADSFNSWADSFNSWADSFNSWADGYVGEGRPVLCGEWTSSFNSWADSFNSWADSFNSWADANPNLGGAFADWTGGYTQWSGGYETWTESFNSWADGVGDPTWAGSYADQSNLPTDLSPVNINLWIELAE